MGAIGSELRHIALGRGVLPHFAVHGGRQNQRHTLNRTGQAHEAEQVVRTAVQQLGHEVSAGGRHDHRIRLSAQIDVRHIVGLAGIPLRHIHRTIRQGL